MRGRRGSTEAGSPGGGLGLPSRIPRLFSRPPGSLGLLLLLAGTGCAGGEEGSRSIEAESGGVFATLELESSFPESFSYLSGVRELPDGTLLAADPTSVVLLRLDMAAGRADTVGRTGEGPEEYRQPDHVFPLPADSSLLVDLGNGRLTVMDPAGNFVRWIPMARPTEDGSSDILHPSFADGRGGLYELAARGREAGPPDSVAVVRTDWLTLQGDTVAWAWRPDLTRRGRDELRPILRPMDDWAVGRDGRVAVIRANGVSVDWHHPDGTAIRGPAYAFETFPVGEAEKVREVDWAMSSAVMSMVTAGPSGIESRSMSRGVPSEYASEVGFDAFDWPAELPAFQPLSTLVSPRGNAWVTRMMPAGGPGRMEIFGSDGILLGYVEIPPSSRVIGFGVLPETEGLVYLVRTDDVGLKWLERHRLARN